ncbi:peroxiredoxin family protein [Mucilaginibacter sp. X5P1]|uniref:peroxiredoxin family protein n=1 Tax=Mucilaginibacter sp. X5P1 TaxID=2723088 RepID=UPI00160DF134|nr:TlpA disulfide reductase family protein [Mucilaginibacter sp. X5P1]MBB6139333.1 peroxiredoxin [Mucilaginibacter sp. X5P1]
MSYFNNGFIRLFACVLLVSFSIEADAQASLIKNAIDKLDGCKNFSYEYIEKTLDHTTDTTTKQHKDIFQKAPGDENFGYLFSLETQEIGKSYHVIDLYNGQSLISLVPDDSTYQFADIKKYAMESSISALPGFLKWLKGRPEKRPSEMAGDTAINGAFCYHAIFHIYDTTINKEHYHTDIHVFIDKLSGLPNRITMREKVLLFDNVANYYTAYQYSNYKFNQKNIDIAAITVPNGFHPPKNQAVLPLLAPGTVAPDWTLYTTDGKQLSMAQLKGKVVLMDFFFIGCDGCMASLQSLDRIYEKYKDQNFVLVSISNRDSRKVVAGFKKNYHIKNPVCGDGADVAKAYHLPGAPLFYYIDKEGKIANVIFGYDDDFESKTTALIDSLLSK